MSSIQDFWPPIEEAININNNPSQPNSASHVQCPICMEAIAVTSFPPVAEREADVLDTDPTLGEILLCGHVLCQACRVQNEASSGRWESRRCPMCRTALQCVDCGIPSQVVPIPKEGSASSVPALLSGGHRCRDCKAIAGFDESIKQGEWPEGLEDLEPGFVPLFYHMVTKLQQQHLVVCKETIIGAFSNILDAEFNQMMNKRSHRMREMREDLEGERPWFEEDDTTSSQVAEPPSPHVHWPDSLAPYLGDEFTARLAATQPAARGRRQRQTPASQRNFSGYLGSLAARPTPRAGLRRAFGPRRADWPVLDESNSIRLTPQIFTAPRPPEIGAPPDMQPDYESFIMNAVARNIVAQNVAEAATAEVVGGGDREPVDENLHNTVLDIVSQDVDFRMDGAVDELADERYNDWQPYAFGSDQEVVEIYLDSNGNDGEQRSIDDSSSDEDDGDDSGTYFGDHGDLSDSSDLSDSEDEDVEMAV